MRIITRIKIGKDKIFFSVGPMELLENIEAYSSIKKATGAMNMSYTKALRIIRTIEEELGFAVVASEKGGKAHGMTRLTPRGKRFLEAFKEMQSDVSDYAEKRLEKFDF